MDETKNIKVKAPKGKTCPIPGQGSVVVKDDKFTEIRDTVYVRRLIREGSLEIEQAAVSSAQPAKAEPGTTKKAPESAQIATGEEKK